MIQIYHNPRCRKSREGLEILKNSNQEFTIKDYLKDPPTIAELNELIKRLDISPIQLIRKGEAVWKENFKGKSLSDQQIFEAMVKHPKLIERPIVVNGNKAVIGRPPTIIKEII
ncbi:MAG: arsenate reductase [Flavobacteriales bacterium]|jgi:arsenate reductase|tara:strand:- start:569 stop:910 length:342 start_codon:yes stop_codon:yes gene_type:complete